MQSSDNLQVIILAGGLGTRLNDLTKERPKPLVEVAGEPFLAHQLRLLASNGCRRVVLSIGYRGEMIEQFVGDGSAFGLDEVHYVYDGPVLLGTAGAIRAALPLLDPEFFVLYGDSYLDCDYRAVAKSFLASGKLALMTVYRNEGLFDSSNVEFADGNLIVYSKTEKSDRMKHIDYGLGAFRREVFEALPAGERFDLATLYGDLLRQNQLAAFEITERFYEIGSREGIADLEGYLMTRSRTR
jgi:N-acetyl-alpha-D-muramate 1-phosphate uridylyltransferase